MEEEKAYSLALRYLSRFNVPREKLTNYLEKKGFNKALALKVASKLEQQGYLNDLDYARAFVQRKKGKFGSFRIYNELLKKGIDREVVEKAIQEVSKEEEKEALKQVALAYLKKNKGIDSKKLKRRLIGFLTRRGFSQEVILMVLKEVFVEVDSFLGVED